MNRPKRFFLLTILLLVILALGWNSIFTSLLRNRLALRASHRVLANEPVPDLGRYSVLAEDCRANWLLGHLDNERKQRVTLNSYWQRAIACDPMYIKLIHRLNRADLDLARQVNAAYPTSDDPWFWLADISAPDDPEQAIAYYRKGLEYAPEVGKRWLDLGLLLRQAKDYPAAMEAFYHACINGDPGYNGCLYAGNMAEIMGDYKLAIGYYRMSLWPRAWSEADALEQKLRDK